MKRLLTVFLLASAVSAADTLVIAPKEFHGALTPWLKHRRAQGHDVEVQVPQADLRKQVRTAHGHYAGRLRFLVLVGDVKRIPCTYSPGVIIKPYERDPRIANDNAIADVDGDHLPDLAVGRVPADSAAEARAMLARAIAFETDQDFGAWRRRINVVAGTGGFGPALDAILEGVATNFLSKSVPAAYDLHVTYANENSPFCPPPSRLSETVIQRFSEGALMVTYIGHGSRQRLDRMRFGNRMFDIFTEDHAYEVDVKRGAPIVFFNACSTGHFDGAPDCLAEVLLRQKRGPVAIIASSRVSMPYANAIVSKEILEAMLLDRRATIGEVMQQTKRRLMKPKPGDQQRQQIEILAWTAYERSTEKRTAERAEHLFLYNLLGDPLLRIPHPETVKLSCAEHVAPGAELAIEGTTPVAGKVLLEIVRQRTPNVPGRQDDTAEQFQATYERSNRWAVVTAAPAVKDGAFTLTAKMPVEPGTYHIRVWVQGSGRAAMGSRAVRVTKPSD